MLELLRKLPAFRNFWFAQAISQIGDRIHSLALIWLVYSFTGSSAYVGVVMIATTLPGIILGPFAGTFADRHDRKKIMIMTDVIRSFIVFYLAFRSFGDVLTLTDLIVATVFMAISSAFFNPSSLAFLPDIVPLESLTRANATSQLCASASAVAGPLLGSGLIAVIGVMPAFVVNGISFLLSAVFLLLIKNIEKRKSQKREGFFSELKAGWKSARAIPLVIKLLAPVAVVNFFFSAIVILVPVYAEGIYKAGSTGLGIFMSGFGGGMFLSSIFLSIRKFQMKIRTYIVFGFFSIGLAFMLIGSIESFYVTMLGIVISGFMLNLLNINLITLYQRILPDDVRGKVFGLITAISLSLQPVAYGVMGILVDKWAPGHVMLVSGIFILLCTVYLTLLKELKE